MGDILFLAHRTPFPPDRGDKIRAYNVLEYLAAKTRLHLLAFADDRRDMDDAGLVPLTVSRKVLWRGKSRVRATLEALVQGRAASLTAFDSGDMRIAVANVLAREAIDTIYVFSGQMAQYVPVDFAGRVIMDFCDMDSLKFADYAQGARGPMRWLMAREAAKLQAFEAATAKRVDASLFVSAAEAELFRRKTGAANVMVVENGIDTDFFDPAAKFDVVTERGPLIVFTGQMDYRPNVEAVTWFVCDILPTIRAEHPDACFAIVGRNPTEAVRALAGKTVIVTGKVADVRGWLAAAACVVAPLKIARGIQNKVLEAMAMARPVVVSGPAADGIDHNDAIVVGRGADGIAQAVVDVLGDKDRADKLGKQARVQVQRRYGWDARLAPLDALIGCDKRVKDAA